jgi:hypothetical protein
MENTSQALDEVRARIRQLERQLRRWRIGVLSFGLALIVALSVSVARSQQGSTPIRAPFTIVGEKGETLLFVDKWQKPGSPVYGTALTLYVAQTGASKTLPAATIVASGDLYKDASDPQADYLNVVETYLYKYGSNSRGPTTTPYKASSLGLTRAGGSQILWNLPKEPNSVPTPAARLTAKRDVGGELILSSDRGKEGTTLKP